MSIKSREKQAHKNDNKRKAAINKKEAFKQCHIPPSAKFRKIMLIFLGLTLSLLSIATAVFFAHPGHKYLGLWSACAAGCVAIITACWTLQIQWAKDDLDKTPKDIGAPNPGFIPPTGGVAAIIGPANAPMRATNVSVVGYPVGIVPGSDSVIDNANILGAKTAILVRKPPPGVSEGPGTFINNATLINNETVIDTDGTTHVELNGGTLSGNKKVLNAKAPQSDNANSPPNQTK